MESDEAVAVVIEALNSLGVPYCLVGSFASNAYGIPRSTRDADFVIALGTTSIRELSDRLGPGFRLDPPMSFELVTITTRYQLKVVDTSFEIELFLLSEDDHDRKRFQRRRPFSFGNRRAFILTPEDVIVTKIRWISRVRRLKDMDDVRNVMAVQGERLDWTYIENWCEVHDTRDVLNEIRDSLSSEPPKG